MSKEIKQFLDNCTVQAALDSPCMHEWKNLYNLANGQRVGYRCNCCDFHLTDAQYKRVMEVEKND